MVRSIIEYLNIIFISTDSWRFDSRANQMAFVDVKWNNLSFVRVCYAIRKFVELEPCS